MVHPKLKSWVGMALPVLTKRPYAREGGRPGSPGGLNGRVTCLKV